MKIFISYKFTGEDIEELKKNMDKIFSILKEAGHEPYCTLWDDYLRKEPKTKKEIFEHTFKKMEEADLFLVLLKSEDKSEGILIEVGYILSKNKRFILAIKQDVKKTYLRDLADKVLEFKDIDDLCNKLKDLK